MTQVINLLENCLETKESQLWDQLGDAWKKTRFLRAHSKNITRNPTRNIFFSYEWPEKLPLYQPIFKDGWSPPIKWMSEIISPSNSPNNTFEVSLFTQNISFLPITGRTTNLSIKVPFSNPLLYASNLSFKPTNMSNKMPIRRGTYRTSLQVLCRGVLQRPSMPPPHLHLPASHLSMIDSSSDYSRKIKSLFLFELMLILRNVTI